ncbi:MAG: VWA domain-containing protein [Verrucomicrobiaceae bacterium]|nr:VWA domain-containing protein [Verrucomicrobiaceae bacterium]
MLLILLAVAGPAHVVQSSQKAVVLLLDHSQSMGNAGIEKVNERANALRATGPDVQWQSVAVGLEPVLITNENGSPVNGTQTDYGKAVKFAAGLFPAGTQRTMVLIGDGHETRGSVIEAARAAAAAGITLHTAPIAGDRRPDVRISELKPNRQRLHEGAALRLQARVESTVDGTGTIRLFENGLEVEKRPVSLKAGDALDLVFDRVPRERNVYRYRTVLEGFGEDHLPANNGALAIVDVRGRLRLLMCEGQPSESASFVEAMDREGIQLEIRGPGQIPATVAELSGYDGIILSDIQARAVGDTALAAMKEYIDKLGGGLVMIGGPNAFGVGGYYRSPLDEALPVRLKPPDEEEKQSSALAIVMDRSGSMAGEKLETAKSAAVAAAEVLGRNDYVGVYAFDSEAKAVTPMTRVVSLTAIRGQIASLASGGGTNLEPAFKLARESLARVRAKIKHMIVLTDGQTAGTGYENMASQARSQGITISTVAIGDGSHVGLLQAIASAGGGQAYLTQDVSSITRIFTQDTLMHTGQMLREEPTETKVVERSDMLTGLDPWDAPALLGYVKTIKKASAQLPLITDSGDPLLATWRFGLGKVTAFTSDVKSRWAGLWISRWEGFGAFWGQILRETAMTPQGQRMDIHCEAQGNEASVVVDLMENATTRANGAEVQVEVFHVASDALNAPLRSVSKLLLNQEGPGEYTGKFQPDQSGVYLVRAQAGSETVSAGLVYQPSGEASLGTVNENVLKQAAEAAGGRVLTATEELPQAASRQALEYVELWPSLIIAFLLLWLIDIIVRRWEHVLSLLNMRRAGNSD